MKGRRKAGKENIRSLIRTSGGRSYAVTLPIEIVREYGWTKRQKLEFSFDPRGKRIIISDWSRKK